MVPAQRLTLQDVRDHRWLAAPLDAPVDDEPIFRSLSVSSGGSAESSRFSLDEESVVEGGCVDATCRGSTEGTELDPGGEVSRSWTRPGLTKQPAFGEAQSLWVH